MNKIIKSQRGATAILLTLLILSAMLFVALTASDIINNGLQMSKAHVNSTKAYYGAEAGAERILWEIRKNGIDPVVDLWGDEECVQYDAYPTGDIDTHPTGACPSPYTNNNTQKLENDVVYFTEYTEDSVTNAPDVTVRLKLVGDYEGTTRRAVEVNYID